MNERITALLPRGPQTAVLPLHDTRGHPSFPNALPAIIAEPVALGYCTDCAWLARMIRAGRHAEQYGLLALRHYAIHATGDIAKLQTRHNRCPS